MKLTGIVKTLGSFSGGAKNTAAKKDDWTQAPALNKGLVSDDSANRVNPSTSMPGRKAKVVRGRPAEGQPVSQADSQGMPACPEPAVLAREKGANFLGASGSPAQGGEVAVGPGKPDWSGPSAPASQLKRLPDAPPLFKLDGRLMAKLGTLLTSPNKHEVAKALTKSERSKIEERLLADVADLTQSRETKANTVEAFLAIQLLLLETLPRAQWGTGMDVPRRGKSDKSTSSDRRDHPAYKAALHNLGRMQKELEKIDASGRTEEGTELQRALEKMISGPGKVDEKDLGSIYAAGKRLPLEMVEEICRHLVIGELPLPADRQLRVMGRAVHSHRDVPGADTLPSAARTIRNENLEISLKGSGEVFARAGENFTAPGAVLDWREQGTVNHLFDAYPHIALDFDKNVATFGPAATKGMAKMIAQVPVPMTDEGPAPLTAKTVQFNLQGHNFSDDAYLNRGTSGELGKAFRKLEEDGGDLMSLELNLDLDFVQPSGRATSRRYGVIESDRLINETAGSAPTKLKKLSVKASSEIQGVAQAVANAVGREGNNLAEVRFELNASPAAQERVLRAAGHENAKVTHLHMAGNQHVAPAALALVLNSEHNRLEKLEASVGRLDGNGCADLAATLKGQNAGALRELGLRFAGDTDFGTLGSSLAQVLTHEWPERPDGRAQGLQRLSFGVPAAAAAANDLITPLANALTDTKCKLPRLTFDARFLTREKTLELIGAATHQNCNLTELHLSGCRFMNDPDVVALLALAAAHKPTLDIHGENATER